MREFRLETQAFDLSIIWWPAP